VRVCTQCASVYVEEVEFCGLDGAPLADQDTDPLIDRELERYAITGLLGAGGMGRVYQARHVHFERDYAIKVLYGDLAANKGSVRRFKREAEAAGRLDHPNVVRVHDFAQSADGLFFLVMELVRGRTLREALREDGTFDPDRTRHVLRQVVQGLAAAHERGIVHRDLKPANIMLVGEPGEERVKIVDFGLAGVVEDDDVLKSKLTSTGSTLGTPAYMAPEQAFGSKVTRAADLYSLGVVMYEMLSGKLPFADAGADVMMQKMVATPVPLQGQGALAEVTAQLLLPMAADRPSDAAVIVQALDHVPPAPLAASAPEVGDTVVRSPASAPGGRVLLLAGLLVAVVAAVALWAEDRRATSSDGPGGVSERVLEPSDAGRPQPPSRDATTVANTGPAADAGRVLAVALPDAAVRVPADAAAPTLRRSRRRARRDAGVVQASSAATAPDPAPSRAQAMTQLDRTLTRALSRRGLNTAEIALLPSLTTSLQAWSDARREAPPLEATAKLQQLVSALQSVQIPLPLLEAKLDRIGVQLERPGERSPEAQRALEDRYLDLSSRVAARPSAAVRGELAKALAKLEAAAKRL